MECTQCGATLRPGARFCNSCGYRLDENRATRDMDGRAKLHADIAHPINSMCREKIQSAVLASYAEELERSKMPGYVSRYDDYDNDDFEMPYENPKRISELEPVTFYQPSGRGFEQEISRRLEHWAKLRTLRTHETTDAEKSR